MSLSVCSRRAIAGALVMHITEYASISAVERNVLQFSLRGNHGSEAARRGSRANSTGRSTAAQAEKSIGHSLRKSVHPRSCAHVRVQLGFVAESIPVAEEEALRITEPMTEMPTLEPCDVTVEGARLIQAMEDIDRERDLLTISGW